MANQGNIRTFVNALRSGEYKQGQGALRKGDCHCVWGVACDVSGVGMWKPYTGTAAEMGLHLAGDVYSFNDGGWDFEAVAPGSVVAWLDLHPHDELQLMTLNGALELTFPEIAEYLEEKYLKGDDGATQPAT